MNTNLNNTKYLAAKENEYEFDYRESERINIEFYMSVKESLQYTTENFMFSKGSQEIEIQSSSNHEENKIHNSAREVKEKTKNYCGSKINCHCILV